FLRGHGITPEPHHFENATPFQILARSIRNLIFSYEKMENTERVMELRRLLSYVVHYEKISS
ncbi:hypothetical protein QLX67_12955, partial [Balneolaceae bacterium ANBcel3]|nr:hypothetical protein [Balneolaceae bacterium ANBcel3]